MQDFPFITHKPKIHRPYSNKRKRNVLNKYNILASTSKTNINEIINIIFDEFCKLDVYGYNTTNDEFWGKKGNKLYFRLELKEYDTKNTTIVINPIIGDEDEVKRIYNGRRESICIYEDTFA